MPHVEYSQQHLEHEKRRGEERVIKTTPDVHEAVAEA